jgi:hypothetical protein
MRQEITIFNKNYANLFTNLELENGTDIALSQGSYSYESTSIHIPEFGLYLMASLCIILIFLQK